MPDPIGEVPQDCSDMDRCQLQQQVRQWQCPCVALRVQIATSALSGRVLAAMARRRSTSMVQSSGRKQTMQRMETSLDVIPSKLRAPWTSAYLKSLLLRWPASVPSSSDLRGFQ